VRYDVVHVAAYSPRPGTAAGEHFIDDVTALDKKERLWAVERQQELISQEINQQLLDSVQDVLVEGRDKGDSPRWKGRTRTNKLAFFAVADPAAPADSDYTGRTLPVTITRAGAHALQGRVTPVAERSSHA
jgi:tRNA-2-methylthio-N6-dimethylallyladenosine synthase